MPVYQSETVIYYKKVDTSSEAVYKESEGVPSLSSALALLLNRRGLMKPTITGRRGLCALVVLITIALLAGCGGAGAGGSGDGDGGSGLDTIPAASDLQIYEPQLTPTFALNPWANTSDDDIEDFSGAYRDLNGNALMEVTVSGTPPVAWQEDADVEFGFPAGFYSDPDVASYAIMPFFVVDSGGNDIGEVSLQDLSAIQSADPTNFTGHLDYYDFWWVAEDLTISGQAVVGFNSTASMTTQATLPTFTLTVDLELKAGWNVVRISDAYTDANLVSETLVVAPISATARWIFEPYAN